MRSKRVQALVDTLVATLDLRDIVDGAPSSRTQGGQQHRHSRSDVGRFHRRSAQRARPAHDAAMRVAEHDVGSHPDQAIDKEESRFEHLFVNEHDAIALRCSNNRDGHRICGKCRPRLIFELGYVAAEILVDVHFLTARNDEIRTVCFAMDSQSLEAHQG